jgi:hypothetical protein
MHKYSAFVLTWALFISTALAIDVPQGADALPFLVKKATTIVEASQFRTLESASPRYKAYSAVVKAPLQGALKMEQRVDFYAPASLGILNPESTPPSLLFLSVAPQKEVLEVGLDPSAYRLVSGRHGVVPTGDGGTVLDAVRTYIKFGKEPDNPKQIDTERFRWAERYMTEKNPFLQRSAVQAVFPFANDDKVLTLLDRAIQSDAVSLPSKTDAVNVLSYSQSDLATTSLSRLAETKSAPESLRSVAIRGVANLPGGMGKLREWRSSDDNVLRTTARIEFDKRSRNDNFAQLKNFDGDGGGEVAFAGTDIGRVDGKGNWIITGNGQNITIEKKDGDGSLVLRNFGEIRIREKDGRGNLTIEPNNRSISIATVNGPGHIYLRNPGAKSITMKDGPGNVYFRGNAPYVTRVNGEGQSIREDN